MLKIGVTYKTTEETLANLGLPPNRETATPASMCIRPMESCPPIEWGALMGT